jgi:hypothetical protein
MRAGGGGGLIASINCTVVLLNQIGFSTSAFSERQKVFSGSAFASDRVADPHSLYMDSDPAWCSVALSSVVFFS